MVVDKEQLEKLSARAFSVIELVELAGLTDAQFTIIRKRLLDLGNDIRRLGEVEKVGE